MNNKGSAVGTVVLVTVLLFLYPSGSAPNSSPASKESMAGPKPDQALLADLSLTKQSGQEKSQAIGLINEFPGKANAWKRERNNLQIECLIATIPDPEQSRLPYLADAYLDALQRAAETDGYVQDRLRLPWKRKSSESGTGKNAAQTEKEEFEGKPGVILFRSGSKDEGKTRLLVLFLVGETPTSGIYKEALKNALHQASQLMPDDIREFKLLGPTLSGSAISLRLALKEWLATRQQCCPRQITIIGTATAINPKELMEGVQEKACKDTKITWQGTLISDDYARHAFYDYLLNRLKTIKTQPETPFRFEVALLTEGTTAYGQNQRPEASPTPTSEATRAAQPAATASPSPTPRTGNYKNKVLNLTFPLHISRLRSMAWKNQTSRQKAAQDPFNFQSPKTPLPLEEDQGTIVPIYSDVSASYAEVVLATILEEIERQHIRYLGIVATDIRDRIFLAREIRRHSPNLVLFFLSSELLFLHPEINRDLQGSLLLSTYPLAPQSKLWSPSFYQHKRWLQFPVQSAQGIYNAALALLGQDQAMQEYEPPAFGQTTLKTAQNRRPTLWLSVVGRDNIWPLTTLEISEKYLAGLTVEERDNLIRPENYLFSDYKAIARDTTDCYALSPENPPGMQERLHSRTAFIALYCLLLVVCLLPTYGVIAATWGLVKTLFAKLLAKPYAKPFATLYQRLLQWLRPNRAKANHLLAATPKRISSHFVWMIFGDLVYPRENSLPGRRQVYLSGCLLAMLCLSFPVWLISAIPLVFSNYWYNFSATDQGLIWWGLLSATFIVLWQVMALARSLYLLLKSWAQTPPRKRGSQAEYRTWNFAVLVIFVMGLPLLALTFLARYHFLPLFAPKNSVELILLWERTIGNFSGVSPLMPLALIATATLTWAFCSLRRLRLLERRCPPTTEQSQPSSHELNRNELGFLSLETNQPGANGSHLQPIGISQHEQTIFRLISCPINQLPGGISIAGGVILAGLMTMGIDMAPSVEGKWYNRGVTALFIMAYLAIAFNFVRFLALWGAMRNLLRRLSWHPLLMGYRTPDPATDPVLGRLRLDLSSPIPTFTTLTKSVEQARLFWQVLQKTRGNLGTQINPAPIKTAEDQLAFAFNYDATGEWQKAFDARNGVRVKLIEFSREVATMLRRQWLIELQATHSTATYSAPMPKQPLPAYISEQEERLLLPSTTELPQSLLEQGERFLISRLIGYLQYVLAQMQNLVVFVTLGILLMLAAMLSYPFQPRSPLLIFNWITILTVVFVTMLVFIQMNRNPTLSLLSGTRPGELSWNSQFILQVVIHGLLPLLAITSAQFSDSLRDLMMSLGMASGGASP